MKTLIISVITISITLAGCISTKGTDTLHKEISSSYEEIERETGLTKSDLSGACDVLVCTARYGDLVMSINLKSDDGKKSYLTGDSFIPQATLIKSSGMPVMLLYMIYETGSYIGQYEVESISIGSEELNFTSYRSRTGEYAVKKSASENYYVDGREKSSISGEVELSDNQLKNMIKHGALTFNFSTDNGDDDAYPVTFIVPYEVQGMLYEKQRF